MSTSTSHPDNPFPKPERQRTLKEKAAYQRWYRQERRLRGTKTIVGFGDGRSSKVKVLSDL